MAKVPISSLRATATALLNHLEETVGSEVEISEDYYWDVAVEQRYDKVDDPTKFTVGQLSSDIEEVLRLADGTKEPLNYGLVWLAQVLRRIGESKPG